MELHLEDYLDRRRDTVREQELAIRLRELPEPQRFEYIRQILEHNVVVGLQLANACLRDKAYFAALLKEGLQIGDASSISLWLQTVLPRLGLSRVLHFIRQEIECNPDAVDKALYWLPQLVPADDSKARNQIWQLQQLFSEKHSKQRSESESVSATL